MQPTLLQRLPRRPFGGGPFFDYVCEAAREHARRLRAQRAQLARRDQRRADGRLTSAEQRWEGEGGNTRQCAPGGPG